MYELVKEIIERFGPRLAGSKEEKEAQLFFEQKMKDKGYKTFVKPFRSSFTSKFESLKLFSLLFISSLVVYFFNPVAAAIIGQVNALLFFLHFVAYRDTLDFLFKKEDSHNVYGDLEPKKEAKMTVLIAGHIDSVREFQWWYRWGHPGVLLSGIAGYSMLFYGLWVTALYFLPTVEGFPNSLADYVWIFFAVLSPTQITLSFLHGKRAVDGAIDNLSGVATAWGVGESLRDESQSGKSQLDHIRIRVMSFAAEEPGLRGAREYAVQHKQELLAENAVLLNIDSVKNAEMIKILKAEFNTLAWFPKPLVREVADAFKKEGHPVPVETLQLGASDASAFQRLGLPAICIISMPTDKVDPTYHTRRDVIENLDPKGMERVRDTLSHLLRDWDQRLAKGEKIL